MTMCHVTYLHSVFLAHADSPDDGEAATTLTSHCPSSTPPLTHSLCTVHVTGWMLDGATLAIYTPIGMCGVQHFFGRRMQKISTKFN